MPKRVANPFNETQIITVESFVSTAEQIAHSHSLGVKLLRVDYSRNWVTVEFSSPSLRVSQQFLKEVQPLVPYPELSIPPRITQCAHYSSIEFRLLIDEIRRSTKKHCKWSVRNVLNCPPPDNLLNELSSESLPLSLSPTWDTPNGLLVLNTPYDSSINANLIVLGRTLSSHNLTAQIHFEELLHGSIACFDLVVDQPVPSSVDTHLRSYYTTVNCYTAERVELWDHPNVCGHYSHLKDRWFQLRFRFLAST